MYINQTNTHELSDKSKPIRMRGWGWGRQDGPQVVPREILSDVSKDLTVNGVRTRAETLACGSG